MPVYILLSFVTFRGALLMKTLTIDTVIKIHLFVNSCFHRQSGTYDQENKALTLSHAMGRVVEVFPKLSGGHLYK